jgi:competence protein ComGC
MNKEIGNKKGNKNIFNNICESYNGLKPVWKKIIKIWGVILILIILLIIICNKNKRVMSTHTSMEKAMNEATLKYVEDKGLYGTVDKKLKVTLDELLSDGYLKEGKVTDNTCTGYSLVYYENKEYNINSYLLCKGYTTEGYEAK